MEEGELDLPGPMDEGDDTEDISSEVAEASSAPGSLTMELEVKIATFYQEHPMYYDLGHVDYKNRYKRNAVLKKFSNSIGLTPEKVKKRFTSNRTDHIKLWNLQKKAKIDTWDKRLTPLQKFKMDAYKFLQVYYKPRSVSQTAGHNGSEDSDESRGVDPEEEQWASRSEADYVEVKVEPIEDQVQPYLMTIPATNSSPREALGSIEAQAQRSIMSILTDNSSPRVGRNIMKTRTHPCETVDVLEDLRQDSQREHKEATKKVDTTAGAPRVSDRETWGQWLLSMHNDIPEAYWREYQRESFLLAQRFLMAGSEPSQPLQGQPFQSQQGFAMLTPLGPPAAVDQVTSRPQQQYPSRHMSTHMPAEHVTSPGCPPLP